MADVDLTPRRPILVGIGGDSGSGKSTLAAAFYDLFGEDRITTICLDDYHALDRRERKLVGLTALDPRANNFYLMEEQLLALKRGEAIDKPIYDHADGTFKGPERVEPKEVAIIQGLHPFLASSVRNLFDLKVWLDPEPELRVQWKLQRDQAKRGYNEKEVREELEARRPDVEAYITPQRATADMVVRFFRPEPELRDMGHLNVRVGQRHTLPRLSFDQSLDDGEIVRFLVDVEDLDGQQADVIEIDGRVSTEKAMKVEEEMWHHIGDRQHHLRRVEPLVLGSYDQPSDRGHSDPLALTQLILAHRILSAEKSVLVRISAEAHDGHGGQLGDHQHV